jgi:hypothetical protein
VDSAHAGLALSRYALGYADAVRAPAPLPQYLAAVYGGVLVNVDAPPALNVWVPSLAGDTRTPEGLVDLLAQVYPRWEPDAVYVALRPIMSGA